ncbi:glutamyl-tRNA reductase [Hominifimenecus sp. rT4P-3]|uniref:glutamyl-tRNA reductase n=1 Tax=Hominifimenecus sp. rT4P-3 TaxID=3242979 RepID=UPI003DA28FB3
MSIQMAGIDHSLAPIPVREKFSFTKKAQMEALEALKLQDGVSGCMILSTCNRTELWVNSREEQALPLEQWLCEWKELSLEAYRKYLVQRTGAEAISHLFRLTSGLKSMILGEDQILTQVREAWNLAREAESTDPVLEVLFRMALTVGKKVKSNLQMSTANTSAIEHAIRFLKQGGYDFSGKTCLVIGNGEMGKRSALALVEEGADVTVTVRQYRSGMVEIPAGCKRINYGERMELLPACDLVVSATSSPNTTIKYSDLAKQKMEREMIFIDLAVPRDIEPEIKELPKVTLYDIDHFPVCPKSKRLQERLAVAEQLLQEQQEEFASWYECRDVVPKVQKISQASADDLVWRMGKTLKKLPLSAQERALLEAGAEDAASKVVRRLLFALRDEAGSDVLRQCLSVWENLYHE